MKRNIMRGVRLALMAALGMVCTLAIFVVGIASLIYLLPTFWVGILVSVVIGVCCGQCLLLTEQWLKKAMKG